MSCACTERHHEFDPIPYRETEEYLDNGRRNPYYGCVMVSHLVCRRCLGNVCVSYMTLDEYYRDLNSL